MAQSLLMVSRQAKDQQKVGKNYGKIFQIHFDVPNTFLQEKEMLFLS